MVDSMTANHAIFLPMLALMVLTAIVWTYMYMKRIPAMYKVGLSAQTYTTRESISEHLPAKVNYPANNLKNLFELPILFYALCLYLFVSDNVDGLYLAAAWVFVALRTMHSAVHCTVNIVMLRFYVYLSSALLLWVMLLRALIGELAVYF